MSYKNKSYNNMMHTLNYFMLYYISRCNWLRGHSLHMGGLAWEVRLLQSNSNQWADEVDILNFPAIFEVG